MPVSKSLQHKHPKIVFDGVCSDDFFTNATIKQPLRSIMKIEMIMSIASSISINVVNSTISKPYDFFDNRIYYELVAALSQFRKIRALLNTKLKRLRILPCKVILQKLLKNSFLCSIRTRLPKVSS